MTQVAIRYHAPCRGSSRGGRRRAEKMSQELTRVPRSSRRAGRTTRAPAADSRTTAVPPYASERSSGSGKATSEQREVATVAAE
ncbi:hypothetical protein GCM10020000_00430 [Streptomyces olivoverticillatus]